MMRTGVPLAAVAAPDRATVSTVEDRPHLALAGTVPPVRIEPELEELIRTGDRHGARELIVSWVRRCAAEPGTTGRQLHEWLLGELLFVMDVAAPSRLPSGRTDWLAGQSRVPLVELLRVTDIHDWPYLRPWLDGILERVLARPVRVRRANAGLVRAERYLAERYADPSLRLDDVARLVNISPFHLAHLFRKERNTTFLRHLTGVRMRAARELLHDDGLSIDEIAAATGYPNTVAFRRTFRRCHGCTPTEYRRGTPPSSDGAGATARPR
jgi:AraC-like DNA-binding protein